MKSFAPVILLMLAAVLVVLLFGQAPAAYQPLSIVDDYSHKLLITPDTTNLLTLAQIRRDPRYLHNWYLRHRNIWWPQRQKGSDGLSRDWSVAIGGNVGNQSAVAKFNFDVNAAPDCTNDYVVTGVQAGTQGSNTAAANIIAVNNLYSGSAAGALCGTVPTVKFAYNVGKGWVVGAVSLSMDGTKIAFNEANGTASYFHVLTWAKGDGTAYNSPATFAWPAATPAAEKCQTATASANYKGSDMRCRLPDTANTTPYVDYYHDVAYVTAFATGTTMQLHKFTGVFNGTPAEVTTGWPLTVTENDISTPVLDQVTMNVFFRTTSSTSAAHLYYVHDPGGSATPVAVPTPTTFWADGCCAPHGPIVDSTNQVVYVYDGGGTGNQSMVGQIKIPPATGGAFPTAPILVTVGAEGTTQNGKVPDFNNAYYNGINDQTATTGSNAQTAYQRTAMLFTVGNGTTTAGVSSLYGIGFVKGTFTMNTATGYGPLPIASAAAPQTFGVTEFYNPNGGGTGVPVEYLFASVDADCLNTTTTPRVASCRSSIRRPRFRPRSPHMPRRIKARTRRLWITTAPTWRRPAFTMSITALLAAGPPALTQP